MGLGLGDQHAVPPLEAEVARGGTSDLCIVHWPKGIKAKGDIRHQFIHAIDLVPTVLDVLKMKMPTSINGVAQTPLEGVSFAKTFDDPKAKMPSEAQYFEMLGTRAIYLDGWRAYAPWKHFGTQITAEGPGQRQVDAVQHQRGLLRSRRTWPPSTRPSWTS